MATIDPYTAPSEGVPSVNACFEEAYGGAIDAAGALRRFRGRIDGEQAELIELSRRLAMAVPEALVDAGVLGRGERIEAAARAHVAEIATSFRLSEAHAGALVEESRLLVNELPATLAALKEGACAAEHARVVVAEAATVPPEARGRFDEEAAVLAASCTPPQLRRRLRALRERLHPETLRERHRRCREDRAVWVDGELDGMATLHLHLPAQDAFGAYDRIDRAARSVREAGSGATPAERDVRNLRQVRADVATALLLDGETVTAPEEPDGTRNPLAERPRAAVPRGIRAVVAVTVPVLTLLGRSDEPAILDGYGPVDAQTARELAASAPSLTRILTDPHTGATLGVGRRSYRPPAELRRALAHRDETCRFPGCLRTARTAEIDHTVPWQHGGATDAANHASRESTPFPPQTRRPPGPLIYDDPYDSKAAFMKVFISWSGATSRSVAEALSAWIPKVIQGLEPFVSAKDIDKGANWTVELARELEDAEFGIICLAPDNLLSPWLNYEAGAIARSVNSRACPVLFEVEKEQVKPPISQLQMTSIRIDEFLLLMTSLNKASGLPLSSEALKEALEVWWPRLKEEIDLIPKPETLKRTKAQGAGEHTAELEPEKPSAEIGEMIEEVLHRIRSVDDRVERLERRDRLSGAFSERTGLARRDAKGSGMKDAHHRLLSVAKASGLPAIAAASGLSSLDVSIAGDLPETLPPDLYVAAYEVARDLNARVRLVGENRAAIFEKGGQTEEMPF